MQRPVIASLMIVLGVSLMHAADMTVRVMPRPGTDATIATTCPAVRRCNPCR